MRRPAIIIIAAILVALPALAGVPHTLNVQGVLMDDTGHPLEDGGYLVQFQLWDAATDGGMLWSDTLGVDQQDGVFGAVLQDVDPAICDQPLWLVMTRDGQPPSTPRIELTSVATALRAASVDPDAAVRSLNGLTDHVNLVAGANVTITQMDTTLVIASDGGTGDADWVISGEDLYRTDGRIWVGYSPSAAKQPALPPLRGEEGKDPASAKFYVDGTNEGIYVFMRDADDSADGRAGIFSRRRRQFANPGTGYQASQINTAITGYNDWGDPYTFGVAGYTWFDFNNTGGVLGSKNSGDYWGSLAYCDGNGDYWGMYTPNDLHVGGLTQTNTLRVSNGAMAGYILTSDADGNAVWQAPAAASTDGDWTISGTNMYHSVAGATAIGTTNAHPLADSHTNTTMQVSAYFRPTIALDKTYGGLVRWSIQHYNNQVLFNRSDAYDELGTTAASLEMGHLVLNDPSGDPAITLTSEFDMETGATLNLYSTSTQTTLPTIHLDSEDGSLDPGGSIILRDRYGQEEIILDASHDGSNIGRITTPVLEITGGSDLSEQFDVGNTDLMAQPGMVVSIDPENPGRLTLSGGAYDRRVAGVISGAGGVSPGMLMGQQGTMADGELPVALVGRVYVWADASQGPIEPGDLLTTADSPGHAMKVADHGRAAGAILGKAMTGLESGQGLVLTLVSLQ